MLRTMQPFDYDAKHLVLPCYISAKFDGVRAYRGKYSMTFRSGKPVWGVEHIYRFLPRGMVPDGELLIPGMIFQESSGLIRSHNSTEEAHYYIFDYMNSILPFDTRYINLLAQKFYSDKIHVIKHTLVHTLSHLLDMHQRNIDAGFEGSVIKTPYHVYQFKQSWDWMRIIPERSVDVVVMSMYEGKGKYIGMMGGVQCEGEGVKVKVGTGFNDSDRAAYWDDPHGLVGKTIRVTYKERTKDGSLRHPSFDRIRVDK